MNLRSLIEIVNKGQILILYQQTFKNQKSTQTKI
ncbi:hypothetical protein X929_00430 [Petrotoga olearia DSM 13574]|uniref:Uncharacterized protein n=1 Tax=Petrotoga olearia DSM 13574 TaxID=1122955 RepID=A0A2K1P6X5_9BACT|nr:hypothetical protein X929_00430 [Petrotoga olearia DSM 13574]